MVDHGTVLSSVFQVQQDNVRPARGRGGGQVGTACRRRGATEELSGRVCVDGGSRRRPADGGGNLARAR
jgi:hypothetical protein